MTSETPKPESEIVTPPAPEPPAPEPPAPEPPAPEPQPPEEAAAEKGPPEKGEKEEEWIEEYEKETGQTKPKKKRHWGGVIIVVAIIVIMLVWSLMSPRVMSIAGDTYVKSNQWASLGNYTGTRDIYWLGHGIHVVNTTWGISISGNSTMVAGQPSDIKVLVTKVDESSGNFWFRGTAITLKNVSLYQTNGDFVAAMASRTDNGFGPIGTIHAVFDSPGTYTCQVFVRFTVYVDMRLGFIPMEEVEITADLSVDIVVA
jgi:hypothetical protein